MSVVLRSRSGPTRSLAADAWHAPATTSECSLIEILDGPVLDLGCGPGRLVQAAAELGFVALGVDASPLAVAAARDRGLAVLLRSVFDPLPGEGRWGSVLLIDGNVGIGGDPTELLRRAATLVTPTGTVVVEVEPPGVTSSTGDARLERCGETSDWFPWAWVGADDIDLFASPVGLRRRSWWTGDDRWFALLGRHS